MTGPPCLRLDASNLNYQPFPNDSRARGSGRARLSSISFENRAGSSATHSEDRFTDACGDAMVMAGTA